MVQFYQKIFFDGRVGEKHKQLARLRLSMNHGCRTCNMQNLVGVANIGYSQEHIDAMWRQDYSGFSEDEQAVMELADEIALNNDHGKLTPELYGKLKRHFSRRHPGAWPLPCSDCRAGQIVLYLRAGGRTVLQVWDNSANRAQCKRSSNRGELRCGKVLLNPG
jgi:hypothetical protein